MTQLVIDSTIDLPAGMAERAGILVVPLRVHFGEESFRDKVELNSDSFFEKLEQATELPTTSQPSPGEFISVYEKVPEGETIISIHISARLSGTVQSAQLAAQQMPGRDIRVLDSGNVTAAGGLLVMEALEMMERGASADEVEKMVLEKRDRARLVAILDTLKYAIMGGRVSRLQGAIGGLLRVKPMMGIQHGEISRLPPARTWGQAFQKTIEDVNEHGGAERLAVLDARAPDSAEALQTEVSRAFPGIPLVRTSLGPVVATHAGPGAAACAYIAKA